jgi:hypothetical protein
MAEWPLWRNLHRGHDRPLLARLLPVNGFGIAADAQPESRERLL